MNFRIWLYPSIVWRTTVIALRRCGLALLLWLTSCSVPKQGTTTIKDVAGDLSASFEQQFGADPVLLAKTAVAGACLALAVVLAAWLTPGPKKFSTRAFFMTLAAGLVAGVMLWLFT